MRKALPSKLASGIFDHLDDDGSPIGRQYADSLELAEAYDRLGFYAYHLAEHHCSPHGRGPSPNLFLSSVAQRTRHLRLGPLVMLLSLCHPLPRVIAHPECLPCPSRRQVEQRLRSGRENHCCRFHSMERCFGITCSPAPLLGGPPHAKHIPCEMVSSDTALADSSSIFISLPSI